jgi:ubiquinone/menaquinone biosynthesis C-methylase UbiE
MAQTFARPERYERHASRLSRRLYARIIADVEAAGLTAGARVLDVGTGPGGIPRALAGARPDWEIHGLDLEPRMIEYARTQDPHGRVTFTVGDVAALPYPDATFDLIVSSLSQHHWDDVPGGLRDLRRVLVPGGRLWIYDARFLLRRAIRAAGATFPSVRREPVPLSRAPIPLIARLTAQG